MNIMYIGPYRQIDYVGQIANMHLDSLKISLKSNDTLISRPIYFDPSLAASKEYKYDTEITSLKNLDVIVQYVPIDFIATYRNITTIAVPMLDPKLQNISQDKTYDILNSVNAILVDDDKVKSLIKNANINKPIELYEEKFQIYKNQKFNLDAVYNKYKYGFIGQYATNKQILQKIIHSFLLCYRQKNDISLVLFLRGSDNDKKELNTIVENIKSNLNIPKYINPIFVLFGIWNKDEAITALNSIDCYLSLNDDYRYIAYEKLFVSSLVQQNRFVINRNNVGSVETPITAISSDYEYNNTINAVHTVDLHNKMLSAMSSPTNKLRKTEYLSLGNIVCKQVL